MAKTKELHFFVKRTISDGDYGSMAITVGEVAELEKGETFEEGYEEVKNRVKKKFNTQIRLLTEGRSERPAPSKKRTR